MDQQRVDLPTMSNAQDFLNEFEQLESSRSLAEQIERVVILSATHADLESWQRMERQFSELFRREGMDFDSLTPLEFAQRIQQHPSSTELCDALELWIGTRGQISSLGGAAATRRQCNRWPKLCLLPTPIRCGRGFGG